MENGLPSIGIHKLRTGEGTEEHLFSPETIHLLQQAVWTNDETVFDRYSKHVEHEGPRTIRSMLTFRYDACREIPLEMVL